MIKKMMLLAVSAAAVVAFAVPATASATPLIHDENKDAANHVIAVSSNTVSETGLGKLNCATVELTITLTHNTTETASGHGDGVAFGTPEGSHEPGEHCASAFGAIEVEHVTVTSIQLDDEGTGSANFLFVVSSLPGCTVEGTAGLTYSGNTLSLVNGTLTGSPAGIPCSFLDGKISGDFTLQNNVTIG